MLVEGYPGVYLQEVPSGVRTIIAASTSTLALVAHFPRGPVGEPTRVTSWDDVLRTYGNLDRRYVGLDALRDFFAQGGSSAWVTRVAFEQPTVTLESIEKAMVIESKATGTGGDNIQVAVTTNQDGTFDLAVSKNGTAEAPFTSLSADPASPRFVERIVNPDPAEGGSANVQVRDTSFAPTATTATALAGTGSGRRSLTIASVPQPALTLQGLAGWNSSVRVTATANGAGFDLNFTGTTGGPHPATGLTIIPGPTSYVGTAVGNLTDGNGDPIAAVVLSRHPLRVPVDNSGSAAANNTDNSNLSFTAANVPSAASTAVRRSSGNGNSMTISAASAGEWGNNVRIGIAPAAAGFDLLINEYRGSDVARSEVFRNLSVVSTDPQFGEAVVNAQSRLIRITNLVTTPRASATGTTVDLLNFGDLTPLVGGSDGTLPGEPAWTSASSGFFTSATDATQGIKSLEAIKPPNLINLMSVPEAPQMADRGFATYAAAGELCRDALAFLLVDHPEGNDGVDTIFNWDIAGRLGSDLARSAAICFPRLKRDTDRGPRTMPASGAIAGLMARTDAQRGVWKAPAGLDASVSGAEPSVLMTDRQQAALNRNGINCLRVKPGAGTVQWGARTLAGADILASEWKYVPVRRTALMIEQTLRDSLGWVVFEPNDLSLWAQIRLNVGSFMQSLFVQGAFAGATPREAYLVKCDGETTSQQDVNSGIVNILVGFAPLRPAEFVIVRLTQLAGRLAN